MSQLRWAALAVVVASLGGCFGPNYERVANDLRDKNQKLEQDLAKSQTELTGAKSTIAALELSTPRVETLPPARLDVLYTTDRVTLTGLTATFASDNVNVPANSLRIMFRPLTTEGFTIPATGTAEIEAFDLSIKTGENRVGSWSFTPAELKKVWYGSLGLNHFAVNCPWSKTPVGKEITVKITFTDALTGHTFADQKNFTITIPAAPATRKSPVL